MDLSVQKMQPPSALKRKSEAKKSEPSNGDEAVEDVSRDEEVRFNHGNTGYDKVDSEDENSATELQDDRKGRRKNRQLLSGEDLSELTSSLETLQQDLNAADELMNLRAYQASQPQKEEDRPHFEVNI